MVERSRAVSATSEPAESTPASGMSLRAKRVIAAMLAVYWIALFISTHTPIPQMDRMPKFSDKVMHFGAYFGLAFLFSLWRASRRGWDAWSPMLVVVVIALYGVADELLQGPVNRSPEVADWTADVIGAIGGVVMFMALQKRLRRLFSATPLHSGAREK
jgi:VanZ family protein